MKLWIFDDGKTRRILSESECDALFESEDYENVHCYRLCDGEQEINLDIVCDFIDAMPIAGKIFTGWRCVARFPKIACLIEGEKGAFTKAMKDEAIYSLLSRLKSVKDAEVIANWTIR